MKLFLDIGEILLAIVAYCAIGGVIYKFCEDALDFEEPWAHIAGALWPASLPASVVVAAVGVCAYGVFKLLLQPACKLGIWLWDFVGGFIEGMKA